MKNYKRISVDGVIEYEHRVVAGKMIGRTLKQEEEVHHIDFNRQNNNPSNLIIFSTKQDHQYFHNGGTLIPNGDGTFKCKAKSIICLNCGKEVFNPNNQKYCSQNCYRKSINDNKPSKEELIKLLKANPFETVGAMFNVTGNAVRKWCRSYGISYHSKDYKQKKEISKNKIVQNTKRLTNEEKNEVRNLYKEGLSQIKLSQRYNVSRWQIRNALKEMDI